MSAARLILKQPTGWFAAGREVAQALVLLTDGSFQLYMHLCLEANRHTGRVAIESAEWARVLRKDAASIEAGLDELQHQGVCERQQDQVEICDRFWPYEKQVTVAAGPLETEFLRQARAVFLKPACVRSTFTAADEKLARKLKAQRGELGTAAPGHLVRMRPEIRGPVERPIAAAHHQLGVLRILNRGGQPTADSHQLLGPRPPPDGGDGNALVTNGEFRGDHACWSRRGVVGGNALTPFVGH